jgi:hypothetical protein
MDARADIVVVVSATSDMTREHFRRDAAPVMQSDDSGAKTKTKQTVDETDIETDCPSAAKPTAMFDNACASIPLRDYYAVLFVVSLFTRVSALVRQTTCIEYLLLNPTIGFWMNINK